MTKDEALNFALEALEAMTYTFMDTEGNQGAMEQDAHEAADKAITAIKEALALSESSTKCEETSHAQPEQEPVAWMSPGKERLEFSRKDTVYGSHTIPLYTTPPQRKPLTDEELYKVFPAIATYHEANKTLYRSIARAIEAAHGIKGEA